MSDKNQHLLFRVVEPYVDGIGGTLRSACSRDEAEVHATQYFSGSVVDDAAAAALGQLLGQLDDDGRTLLGRFLTALRAEMAEIVAEVSASITGTSGPDPRPVRTTSEEAIRVKTSC
jgi:hypothetical protein